MSNFFIPLENILFIDIETISEKASFTELNERMKKAWKHKASLLDKNVSEELLYFQKAAIYAEFGKIISIGVGFFYLDENKTKNFKLKCFSGHNEKEILNDFKTLIETKYKNKKLIFCAHNGKEFDFPYLCRRMLINEISIPKQLNLSGKKSWEIEHIDTLELWKFGDRKNYTSLDLLTALFDIPGSKNDLDGSKVNEVYYLENGLDRIAQYCMDDVLAMAQLYLKLNNKPLIQKENVIRI